MAESASLLSGNGLPGRKLGQRDALGEKVVSQASDSEVAEHRQHLSPKWGSGVGCFSEAPLAGGRSLRGPVMDCRSAPSESPQVGTEYVHMLRETELAKMAVSKVIPISY